ncbi:oligosaccharide flippase family protein [Rhodoblastus acidophilus]|nr:oligosaccharide flippase family protein [Rhodoblastus acidophilus]
MAISTLARLGLGLIMFIVMARYLGAQQFGVLAGAMAYSGLLNLLSDFGLATYALRLAGMEPQRTVEVIRRALLVKTATTCAGALIGGALLFWNSIDGKIAELQIVVFLAMTVAAYADLAFVASRALGRFDIERRTVLWTSAIVLVIVSVAAIGTCDAVATAWALLAGRIVYALGVARALRRWLCADEPWPLDAPGFLRMARGALPYAVDGALTNLSNQIDIVMVTMLLDATSVGIYQAGARLVQSISPVAVILSTVYLPRLAHAHRHNNSDEVRRLASRLNFEFAGLALFGFLGFLLVGPLWTTYLLGPKYQPLLMLWPGFATFVFTRFAAAAFGIQLAAYGEMRFRIVAQALAIATIVLVDLILLPKLGIMPASWVLAGSSLIPLLIYAIQSARISGARMQTAVSLGLSFAIVALQFHYIGAH